MFLKGSCHCKKVKFEVETNWYYPLMFCYCSICRKANGGLVSCNIKAKKVALNVIQGKDFINVYCAEHCERHFCSHCSASLFILDSRWPEDCWPNAAAIDTPLPNPRKQVQIFVKDAPAWFPLDKNDLQFDEYPDLGIEQWHKKFNLI